MAVWIRIPRLPIELYTDQNGASAGEGDRADVNSNNGGRQGNHENEGNPDANQEGAVDTGDIPYGPWMIVKRPNRRHPKTASGRTINTDKRIESVEVGVSEKNGQGSRFDSLGDSNEDSLQDKIIQDGAITPIEKGQHPQAIVVRVLNRKAGKNAQNGTRGKENKSNNVA